MANDFNPDDILISTPAKFIRELGASVADAQLKLDAAAMTGQANLTNSNKELAENGYQVTWYQIPEATVELKMAAHFESKDGKSPPRLYFAPFNARYKNAVNFTADGASTVKIRIVPVPPVVAELAK
jgi:hypothetical protein